MKEEEQTKKETDEAIKQEEEVRGEMKNMVKNIWARPRNSDPNLNFH